MVSAVRDAKGHARAVVKGLSWRAVGTLDTFVWSLLISHQAFQASSIASTEILTKLADFERIVFLAHYDRDLANGNPRIGWTDVIVIYDLASVAPAPLESKAAKLREVWRTNWEQLGQGDESSVDRIEAAVEDLRQATLSTLRALR